jgi:hypothetical protein
MSKPRSDSPLKNLSEERQEQIIEWCNTPKTSDEDGNVTCIGGYKFARAQLASDGLKVSERALSEFYSWWNLRRDFEQADEQTNDILELIKKLDPSITAEKLETAGQLIFTKNALAMRDAKEFREMEYLKLAKASAKTKGRQEEEKLQLAKDKFAVTTCETFLRWFADKKARAIAEAPISNSEKIDQLRQEYFKDVDALQASGEIQLPK